MFDPHTNDTEYNDELDPDNNYFEALFPSLTSDETSNYVTIDKFFDLQKNFPDGLSIFHLNIRSYNANSDQFFALFKDNSECLPDIFVFTETWFKSSNTQKLSGYDDYHICRPADSGYGGVSIYVNNQFESSCNLNLTFSRDEIEVCTVDITVMDKSFTVFGVYSPPSSSREIFIDALDGSILNSVTTNKTIFLVGDLNTDLLKMIQILSN